MGFPSKSGVAGACLIVVPNVMGICTWSPRLDGNGNSVRGIGFAKGLAEALNVMEELSDLGDAPACS